MLIIHDTRMTKTVNNYDHGLAVNRGQVLVNTGQLLVITGQILDKLREPKDAIMSHSKKNNYSLTSFYG